MKLKLLITSFVLITFACNTNNFKPQTINLEQDFHLFLHPKNTPDSIVAKPQYRPDSAYKVKIPATVMAGLRQNGLYQDIFVGTNLKYVNSEIFSSPWWYKTKFKLEKAKHSYLIIDGINYYADIWLNGQKIADSSTIKNPFRRHSILLDPYIIYNGVNTLAIKVYPPRPGDFNIGFVDWNPKAPDNEMGIFRPLKIKQTGPVAIFDPFVWSKLYDNYSKADLFVQFRLKNPENKPISGTVKIFISPNIRLSVPVRLKPLSDTILTISPQEHKQLTIQKPELWFPHTAGKPALYNCKIQFWHNAQLSDQVEFKFGIREIKEYRTKQGFRGFTINGKRILIKGGGWVDNLFLDNTPENIAAQLQYVKDMNLNTIRLEGFWGNSQTLYNLADSLGIMIMVGWSCQWEWENYLGKPVDEKYGGVLTSSDIDLISQAWKDQILWLRHHPAIIAWLGASDKLPHPEFEKRMLQVLQKYDTTRIYINSAQEHTSQITGFSGMKMRGPYEVVPPIYWFQDTALGGAFGFNSETGPGAQVPPLESIKRFIPPQHLWPIDSVWLFHCGRGEFNSLDRYNEALFNRYGKVDNVQDYAYTAQALNYELMRAMFEAFSAYRCKGATGIIQWMLNSAWPEFYWQLYDYYLVPNGAYFGAKKANRPVNIIYDYAKNCIWAVNETSKTITNASLRINIFKPNNTKLLDSTIKIPAIPAGRSIKVALLPKPEDLNIEKLYFLNLILSFGQNDSVQNFYWLSAKSDQLDYENSQWYFTPFKQYADFTQLNDLNKTQIYINWKAQTAQDTTTFALQLKNTGQELAFLLELKVVDSLSGQLISPVLWSDNYISLLPGQSITLEAKVPNYAIKGKKPYIKYRFWNQ